MPLLNFGLLCRELRVALVGTKTTFFFFPLYEQLCQGLESNLKCVD